MKRTMIQALIFRFDRGKLTVTVESCRDDLDKSIASILLLYIIGDYLSIYLLSSFTHVFKKNAHL